MKLRRYWTILGQSVPHVAAFMIYIWQASKRSPDERSDIRDWHQKLPHPHIAALMRATCSPHRVARMSVATSGTGFPNVPDPHIAALMRATHAGYGKLP